MADLTETGYKEIIGRLDDLLVSQNAMLTAQAVINNRLEVQEKQVNDLSLLVRGGPSVPGLVTEVALIRSMLRDICNNEICRQALGNPGVEKSKKETNNKDSNNITWQWLVDKAMMPIIISFVLWFLLTLMPNLFTHLSTQP